MTWVTKSQLQLLRLTGPQTNTVKTILLIAQCDSDNPVPRNFEKGLGPARARSRSDTSGSGWRPGGGGDEHKHFSADSPETGAMKRSRCAVNPAASPRPAAGAGLLLSGGSLPLGLLGQMPVRTCVASTPLPQQTHIQLCAGEHQVALRYKVREI